MNEIAETGSSSQPIDETLPTHSADGRELSAAARRALAEAAARRAAAQISAENGAPEDEQPGEKGGPKGPEPTRYGDWERKGIAVDF